MNAVSEVLVSVGLPVYNGEAYLAKSLETILNQTYKNIEIIISDNCSTDKTEAICKSFSQSDSRIRYIRQEKNVGVYENFYFVLKEASSNFFLWAAADDYRSLNWIECALKELIKNQGSVFTFGEVQTIDCKGDFLSSLTYNTNLRFANNAFFRRLHFWFLYESFGKANIIYGLFDKERSCLLENTKKWASGNIRYDLTLIFNILLFGNYTFIPNITLFKRNTVDSEQNKISRNRNILHKIFCPFGKGLLLEYLKNASSFEFLAMIVFLPFKYFAGLIFKYWLFMKLKINSR